MYLVLINREGRAEVIKQGFYKPPHGEYLFGFGPYTKKEAIQWAREWNMR